MLEEAGTVDTEKMFAQSARMIAAVADDSLPVGPGMDRWLDYCEQVEPDQNAIWSRLRTLDFEKDAAELSDWLRDLLAQEPPPSSINGLWFGLYNPVLPDGKPNCQMYVGGSAGFDPRSEFNEWVCRLSWKPGGRYSTSRVLAELYRSVDSIHSNQVSCLGEPFLCHGYLALVVSSWCHGPMREKLLGTAAVRAVVIGHDSGDFYRMAVLRKTYGA